MTPATNEGAEVVFIPGMNMLIIAGKHEGSRGRVMAVEPRNLYVQLGGRDYGGAEDKTVLVRKTSVEPCGYHFQLA
jgi:ribosomal protein L24